MVNRIPISLCTGASYREQIGECFTELTDEQMQKSPNNHGRFVGAFVGKEPIYHVTH